MPSWRDKTATGKYDVQELVKCVVDELKSINLTVWMDVDKMNGVLIDTMAGAVKNCQVFMPVVTAKYHVSQQFEAHRDITWLKPTKESPNCKLEFDYEVALQKGVVPVYAVECNELLADRIHMVMLPHIQARFSSIFLKCREFLDFRSHADWDKQMAVLKREILAKLDSALHSIGHSIVSNTDNSVNRSSFR
ncbi:hypothetical protein HDU82_008310, partial [Entophlyctis luteolus]